MAAIIHCSSFLSRPSPSSDLIISSTIYAALTPPTVPMTSRPLLPSRSFSVRLSIWGRKKEMDKEGLVVAKELKRLHSDHIRLDRFIKSQVSRFLKSDLVSVLVEFQRQNQVFLCMKANGLSM